MQKPTENDISNSINFSDHCIFSRNIYIILEEETIDPFLAKHILVCKVCQNKAKYWHEKNALIKHKITNNKLTSKQRIDLDLLIRLKAKEYKISLDEKIKNISGKYLRKSDNIVIDIVYSLKSVYFLLFLSIIIFIKMT